MLSRRKTERSALVSLILLLTVLTGCTKKSTVLTPIWEGDVYINDKDDVCMTEEYMREVFKVKIDKER